MGLGEPDSMEENMSKTGKCIISQGFERQLFQFVPEEYREPPFHLFDSNTSIKSKHKAKT